MKNTGDYLLQLSVMQLTYNFRKKEFASMGMCREEGIEYVLTNLSPLELRLLIKSEEELGQCQNFVRIFPTRYTYQYFRFFEEPLNHSDKLLDAFEHKFNRNRLYDM